MPVDSDGGKLAPRPLTLAPAASDGTPVALLQRQTAHVDSVEVPVTALRAAEEIVQTSTRRLNIPVRKTFVRGNKLLPPPMTEIYRGGRSGVVALKLYLALIWRCSQPPYETAKPTRSWAILLGLPDPSGKGARRVAAAMKALEEAYLVTTRPQAGHPNVVTLRQEDRSGAAYEPPGDAYFRADRMRQLDERARHVYFLINTRLWTEGHIQSMSGPALVLLLILLAERGGEGQEVWFSTQAFPDRYHLSSKTRAAATRELVNRQLLVVERRSLPINGGTSQFEAQRYRSVYHLTNAAIAQPQVV